MREQSRWDRLRHSLLDSLGIRNEDTGDEFTRSIPENMRREDREWNEEENAPEHLNLDSLVISGDEIADVQIGSGTNVAYVNNQGQFYINDQPVYSNISWSDANMTIINSIALRAGYEIEVDEQSNEAVVVRVDSNQYDIEVLEDRIEIRRKFDNESNDIRTHDEPTENGLQFS